MPLGLVIWGVVSVFIFIVEIQKPKYHNSTKIEKTI